MKTDSTNAPTVTVPIAVRRARHEGFHQQIRQIYRLVRISSIHRQNNEAVQKLISQSMARFRELRGLETGRLNLLCVDQTVFVNGQLLKAEPEVYDLAIDLARYIQKLGYNEIAIDWDVQEQDLRVLMGVFARATEDRAAVPAGDIRLEKVSLRRIKPEVLDLFRAEAVSKREQLVRSYASALVTMRHAWDAVLRGKPPALKNLKRLVLQLVRMSEEQPRAFQTVARMRNVHEDPAGQAVKAAMVAIALLRPLTSDIRLLGRVGMASLHLDLGRVRAAGGVDVASAARTSLPRRMTDAQLAALPDETAVAGFVAGHLHPETVERVIVAFEAQLIALDPNLAPLPTPVSLVDLEPWFVLIARRYTEAMGFDVRTQRAMTPEEAIVWMTWNSRNRLELCCIRLLAGALRIDVPAHVFETAAAQAVEPPSTPEANHAYRVRRHGADRTGTDATSDGKSQRDRRVITSKALRAIAARPLPEAGNLPVIESSVVKEDASPGPVRPSAFGHAARSAAAERPQPTTTAPTPGNPPITRPMPAAGPVAPPATGTFERTGSAAGGRASASASASVPAVRDQPGPSAQAPVAAPPVAMPPIAAPPAAPAATLAQPVADAIRSQAPSAIEARLSQLAANAQPSSASQDQATVVAGEGRYQLPSETNTVVYNPDVHGPRSEVQTHPRRIQQTGDIDLPGESDLGPAALSHTPAPSSPKAARLAAMARRITEHSGEHARASAPSVPTVPPGITPWSAAIVPPGGASRAGTVLSDSSLPGLHVAAQAASTPPSESAPTAMSVVAQRLAALAASVGQGTAEQQEQTVLVTIPPDSTETGRPGQVVAPPAAQPYWLGAELPPVPATPASVAPRTTPSASADESTATGRPITGPAPGAPTEKPASGSGQEG
jgi:hypothetical protein